MCWALQCSITHTGSCNHKKLFFKVTSLISLFRCRLLHCGRCSLNPVSNQIKRMRQQHGWQEIGIYLRISIPVIRSRPSSKIWFELKTIKENRWKSLNDRVFFYFFPFWANGWPSNDLYWISDHFSNLLQPLAQLGVVNWNKIRVISPRVCCKPLFIWIFFRLFPLKSLLGHSKIQIFLPAKDFW